MKRLLAFVAALMAAPLGAGVVPEAKPAATHVEIRVMLEAGAGFFSAWPSGKTIHAGTGWIPPYGRADYWCGIGYAKHVFRL